MLGRSSVINHYIFAVSKIGLSIQALASRSPGSDKVGGEGIAPDRVLRCAVLKHIKGWSYRELHRELRASLLYRRFTRFYEDPIPDYFSNLCRAFALSCAAPARF
jgi:Transposase domain (DUF772)